jgi:hypothetical protein
MQVKKTEIVVREVELDDALEISMIAMETFGLICDLETIQPSLNTSGCNFIEQPASIGQTTRTFGVTNIKSREFRHITLHQVCI